MNVRATVTKQSKVLRLSYGNWTLRAKGVSYLEAEFPPQEVNLCQILVEGDAPKAVNPTFSEVVQRVGTYSLATGTMGIHGMKVFHCIRSE